MSTHAELKEQVIQTSLRLIDQSSHGQIQGEDVAVELGIDPNDAMLHSAFHAACDHGDLLCDFSGGMDLPTTVTRPSL